MTSSDDAALIAALVKHGQPCRSGGPRRDEDEPDCVDRPEKDYAVWCWPCLMRTAADRLLQVQQGREAASAEHVCAWKNAIIDATIVDWIYTAEHETNPRRAVNDLLAHQVRLALDPAVSKAAHDLMQRAEAAEAALRDARSKKENE